MGVPISCGSEEDRDCIQKIPPATTTAAQLDSMNVPEKPVLFSSFPVINTWPGSFSYFDSTELWNSADQTVKIDWGSSSPALYYTPLSAIGHNIWSLNGVMKL